MRCIGTTNFNSECCKREHGQDPEFATNLTMIKQRCYDMFREPLDQVQARLPASKNVFLSLSGFSRDRVLSHVSRFPLAKLPLSHVPGDNAEMVENQYRNIILHPWQEEKELF